ncbi:MAG: hypothetical protein OET90_02165, partial [Desulfuromonadales bacterium]|nr:hypothetical protein [Desulfuromonadales bacterium]
MKKRFLAVSIGNPEEASTGTIYRRAQNHLHKVITMHTRITQSIILLLTLLVVTECFASETIPPATEYRFIQSASASSSLEQLKTIRKLFDNREFEKLTNIFERRQKQFEQDPTNERPIVEAFLVFNNSRPADRHLLDEWVEAQPNHFAS